MDTNNCSAWTVPLNARLPPTCGTTAWTYENNSWSWRPKVLNTHEQRIPTSWSDYLDWLDDENKTVHPLLIERGGMSGEDITALENDTLYSHPDIRSATHGSQAVLQKFARDLYPRSF